MFNRCLHRTHLTSVALGRDAVVLCDYIEPVLLLLLPVHRGQQSQCGRVSLVVIGDLELGVDVLYNINICIYIYYL